MSRFIHNKDSESESTHHSQESEITTDDNSQVIYLKRLLVTLKQKYENHLHSLSEQLETEISHKFKALDDLKQIQNEYKYLKNHHEEELTALKQQHTSLKELLKKAQGQGKLFSIESARITDGGNSQSHVINQQRMEQLERVLPYLRERTEEAHEETEKLREDLEIAESKISDLQKELVEKKISHEAQVDQLKLALSFYSEENPQEPNEIQKELKLIRQKLLQGYQESKVIESRYMDILSEKSQLEIQIHHLQEKQEHQSSYLASFNQKLQEIEVQKKEIELQLDQKEILLVESQRQQSILQERIEKLNTLMPEKQLLQDKYEQLKEEVIHLSQLLEEAFEARMGAEKETTQFQVLINEQAIYLHEQENKINQFNETRDSLQNEINELRRLLEEHELALKVAQQHLAKKVKEVTLYNEKVEEQQKELTELYQEIENSHAQITHLQASIDIYQKQEKRVQDQLQEALKSTEIQVNKWEEKYFKMYDNWQQSQNEIRELKKLEEKHNQMQNLLANLGNFMAPPGSVNTSFLQALDNKDKGYNHPFEQVNKDDF